MGLYKSEVKSDLLNVKGLIFDMDGVIFDSESVWKEATFRLNREYDLDFDEDYRQRMCGMNEKDIRSMLRNDFPGRDIDAYRTELTACVEKNSLNAPMKDGFQGLVNACRAKGLRIGLATSSAPERARALFKANSIDPETFFDSAVYGNEVSMSKPDPEIFLKATEKLGLEPHECIVIEDSINGLKAAENGNFIPVMMVDIIEPDEWVLSSRISVVRSHSEAMEIVKFIESGFESCGSRKESPSFRTFIKYSDPIFAITSKLDVTKLFRWCKRVHNSFFIEFMYIVTAAANEIESMRLRIRNGEPVLYSSVSPGFIILKEDGIICSTLVQYSEDRADFFRRARKIIDFERERKESEFNSVLRTDVIYITSLQWIEVVGFKNPYNLGDADSCSIPRIAWGKVVPEGDRFSLTMDVAAHHALMDGMHLASFFMKIQEKLDNFNGEE